MSEITKPNKIAHALAEANITDQVIASLQQYRTLIVKSPDDKLNYSIVKKARVECQDLRILAQKIAKAGRADAIAEQKAWIAEEKRVTGQIEEIENYLQTQENIVDDFEKQQRDAVATQIREKTESRMKALLEHGIYIDPNELTLMDDTTYETKLSEAQLVSATKIARQKKEDEDREEERKRLALQKEEQDKKDAILKEEQKKVDDAKRVIEIETAKKEAEEKGRKEAEAKAERDRLNKIESDRIEESARQEDERKEKERIAKEAARAPDKEKLKKYSIELVSVILPDVHTKEAQTQLNEAKRLLSSIVSVLGN